MSCKGLIHGKRYGVTENIGPAARLLTQSGHSLEMPRTDQCFRKDRVRFIQRAVSGRSAPRRISATGSRFDDEAEAATHEGKSLGHYGMASTVILPLFFLGEPSRLSRRPPACHAGSAKLTSGHGHSHGVLAYSKAADKDGSFVIHGSLHFRMSNLRRLLGFTIFPSRGNRTQNYASQ